MDSGMTVTLHNGYQGKTGSPVSAPRYAPPAIVKGAGANFVAGSLAPVPCATLTEEGLGGSAVLVVAKNDLRAEQVTPELDPRICAEQILDPRTRGGGRRGRRKGQKRDSPALRGGPPCPYCGEEGSWESESHRCVYRALMGINSNVREALSLIHI